MEALPGGRKLKPSLSGRRDSRPQLVRCLRNYGLDTSHRARYDEADTGLVAALAARTTLGRLLV